MVNRVLPEVKLTQDEVDCHYSGVRPLPYVAAGRTGAITRDHAVDTRATTGGRRVDTLVGGKLTTCRAFGEEVADNVLAFLGRRRIADTRSRPLPGCDCDVVTVEALAADIAALCDEFSLSAASATAVRDLFGSDSLVVLKESGLDVETSGKATSAAASMLPGTDLPLAVVDWIITHEQVHTVADLIETPADAGLLATIGAEDAGCARGPHSHTARGLPRWGRSRRGEPGAELWAGVESCELSGPG